MLIGFQIFCSCHVFKFVHGDSCMLLVCSSHGSIIQNKFMFLQVWASVKHVVVLVVVNFVLSRPDLCERAARGTTGVCAR